MSSKGLTSRAGGSGSQQELASNDLWWFKDDQKGKNQRELEKDLECRILEDEQEELEDQQANRKDVSNFYDLSNKNLQDEHIISRLKSNFISDTLEM